MMMFNILLLMKVVAVGGMFQSLSFVRITGIGQGGESENQLMITPHHSATLATGATLYENALNDLY